MEASCMFGLITAPVANHFTIGLIVGIAVGIVISLVADHISLFSSGSK